jgi:hypothetical protein
MKFSMLLLTIFILFNFSHGQILFEENFDYQAGTNLTDYGWTAHSGSGNNPIQIVSPGLVYAGYPASGIGNAAQLISTTSSAEDVNKNFQDQTSGNVYAAFMVNVNEGASPGTYFFHLGPEVLGTTFRGKVFVEKDSSNNIAFGVAKGSNSDAAYTGFVYSLNTTYLIVMEYIFNNSGSTDDEVKLWINPSITGSEPTSDLSQTDTQSDASDLGTVALRQGTPTSGVPSPGLDIDGIRIGTTWESAVSGTVTNPPLISNLVDEPFLADENITITCDVTIASGVVDSVRLYYYTALDMNTMDSLDMTAMGGDQYQAVLNPLPNGSSLAYWVTAWGNDVSSTSSQSKVMIGIPDISTFHLQTDSDGVPLNLGYRVRLKGITTVSTGVFSGSNYDFYMQDNTGGIDLFKYGYGPDSTQYLAGDSLLVVGTIDQYRGKAEVTDFDITVLSSGNPLPDPIRITIEDMGEEYESRLIEIANVNLVSGTWIVNPADTSYNLTVNDGTGDLILRIVGSTDIGGNSQPSWPVNMVGIGSQYVPSAPYLGGYQIQPRSYTDFVTTGISQPQAIVYNYRLDQNYPNPFNPETVIPYQLKEAGVVDFRVYNILGQQIFALRQHQTAGPHTIVFDGKNLPSGIYFYRLQAGDFSSARKMVLAR